MSRFGSFGRCEVQDTCVLDPECEFYAEHREADDDEASLTRIRFRPVDESEDVW